MPLSTNPIRWDHHADGIVLLTLDDPEKPTNTINAAFLATLATTMDQLEAERDDIRGVVVTSAKDVFLAGRDLREVQATTGEEVAANPEFGRAYKTLLRRLETLGRPVVAALAGTALGGGFELALATHHRIVVNDSAIQLGLPEVTLGLLPGGGGVVRTVRMLGVVDALDKVLLPGSRMNPQRAQTLGLIDELVDAPPDLLPAAKRWIIAHPSAAQPWDNPAYRLPGGTPADPDCGHRLSALEADLANRFDPAHQPAPQHILTAAVDGTTVNFDLAMEIERDHYIALVTGSAAKNLIQAFFDLRRVRGDRNRPAELASFTPARAVVLGAGMMGAGIAHALAQAGVPTMLADTSRTLAQRGKDAIATVVTDAVTKGRIDHADSQQLLARVTPTADPADAAGADLLVEAVFEDRSVKAVAFAQIAPHLAADALLASNTSTLPISELAHNVARAADFIGLHFFSPVHKIPLIEIIKGKQTSERTLGRALDIAGLLNKTPIVVNDSPGFFTSRVIRTFNDEGLRMLADGISPDLIEHACRQAGYPTPVLQLSDELNLQLMRRIRAGAGSTAETTQAVAVIDRMLDTHARAGRQAGAGFYDYDSGRRTQLWPGLADAFDAHRTDVPLDDLIERLLFIEALEAMHCLEEGVVESVADANVGSLLGIGYPRWTGGVLQYVNGYAGGLPGFLARTRKLAAAYGDRYQPPDSLIAHADAGRTFIDTDSDRLPS